MNIIGVIIYRKREKIIKKDISQSKYFAPLGISVSFGKAITKELDFVG